MVSFKLADVLLSIIPTDRVPAHLTSYIPGKTPISTWPLVISMTVTYLVVVFGTRETMKDRPPMKLNALFRAHNLLLTVGSFLLMVLIGEDVFSSWLKPEIGTYGAFCSEKTYTPRLEFYLIINYYFKYYELIDTVFLVLKKKPLAFLHVYHHAATAVLAFVQLNTRATLCWVVAVLNLGVHVLMYYYYYATAGGAKIWWKQHLTTMQITQFVIVLSVVCFTTYQYVAFNFFPDTLPNGGGCNISPTSSITGGSIISSYLVLFVDFFYKTYLRKSGSNDNLATLFWSSLRTSFKPKIAAPESLLFKMTVKGWNIASLQVFGLSSHWIWSKEAHTPQKVHNVVLNDVS